MKLELLKKIKQEYAKERGYHTYDSFLFNERDRDDFFLEDIVDEIAHRYAQEFAKQKLEEVVDYIESDAEIAIPVQELMNEDGTHMSKRKYGLVLLKHLCIELRKKFLTIKEL